MADATETLRYSGVSVLSTRYELGTRKALFNAPRNSKYIPSAEFGKTGMQRNRFEDLTTCIAFSYQPNEQGDLSSEKYLWFLVEDFLKLSTITASDICSHQIYCAQMNLYLAGTTREVIG